MPVTRKPKDSASPTLRRRAAPVTLPGPPTVPDELVATEAYLLFMARGGQNGDAVSDWLAAERIVRERLNQMATKAPRRAKTRAASL
jgi:hypothetical protein